jgi:large repetitive protein
LDSIHDPNGNLFEKEAVMSTKLKKALQLIGIIIIGIFMVATVVGFAHKSSKRVLAVGPIPPPDGYPKLTLSTKVVSPTLANTEGAVLTYNLEILNTGAYTAFDVTLLDAIPLSTTYNGDVWSSVSPTPVYTNGMILWEHGQVGFDTSVVITYSVTVTPGYVGIISNTAVISDPMIAEPVAVIAKTNVTDDPVFEISKTAKPDLPGKNKPLTYELVVTNQGQAAVGLPITVTDFVPTDTTFLSVGPDGSFNRNDNVVTWYRTVDLAFGKTSTFTFSVNIGDVPSGTAIHNDNYLLVSPDDGIRVGDPYTSTVIDPIFILSKSIFPDPPGSNNEMTYTLTVLNLGSMATDLVITDTVPSEAEYRRGGDNYSDGMVTWYLPSLDARESAQVTFTVYIDDISNVVVWNEAYGVCSAEGVCAPGLSVPSLIEGPTFEATATLDPIAHKPGGGIAPVTPTLTVQNMGPGNALDTTALITFGRISISLNDMTVIPLVGTLVNGPPCNVISCTSFVWTGDLAVGDVITFSTLEGQNTIGGEEGTHYTATVVITDELSGYVTEPVTSTAIGHVTHYANLIPSKSAPIEIGAGQPMTYTVQVYNSGLSTEESPPPVLTETVPTSVTLLSISDAGSKEIVDGRTVISWELPPMGPGDTLFRSFGVLVDPDLVSGTLIINDDYRTTWSESEITGTLSNLGEPVTTTVREVGLIDSCKTVTPTLALPGTGTVLTYVLHVVNSGPNELSGVQVNDVFPWENTTYQRDAAASAGNLISDIVSLEWVGDVAPYSEQLITFTTVVDDFFEGVVTNTATITHTSLMQDIVVSAVSYITDKPVLRISKTAKPDPVELGYPLQYQIQVSNLGQQATRLVVTDTIPANTSYIIGSASSGGQAVGDGIRWDLPVLDPGQTLKLTFQVAVLGGTEIINADYSVHCDEGVSAFGEPIVTPVWSPIRKVLLPITFRK